MLGAPPPPPPPDDVAGAGAGVDGVPGGGVVLRRQNRELMRATGLVIFLETSLEVLWDRVSTFAQDEFTGRFASAPDYWKQYRARVDAVTIADVQRVAKQHLDAARLVILAVGQKEEILKGSPAHPVSMKTLGHDRVTTLPLRDPLTMKPVGGK